MKPEQLAGQLELMARGNLALDEKALLNEAATVLRRAQPEALRRDVPPEIFDSMAVYMELRIGDKTETIKPSMVADVLDALMRLIRKRWKAEAAESPPLRTKMPDECILGCPPNQVCDYCRSPTSQHELNQPKEQFK